MTARVQEANRNWTHNVAKTQQFGYDGRVSRIISKFLLLFFLVFIVFFIYSSTQTYSQIVGNPPVIQVTPSNVALRTPIQINTTIIPNANAQYPLTYRLFIAKTPGGTSGIDETVLSLFLYMKDSVSCSKPTVQSGDSNALTSNSCQKSGSSTTFNATIDTTKLRADLNSTADLQYKVYAQAGTSLAVGELGSTGFTIQAPKASSAQFSIDSIKPDPAKPGDTIAINLSGTKNEEYSYTILGRPLNRALCGSPTCSLQLTLPSNLSDWSNWTITVFVQDSTGSKTKSIKTLIPTVMSLDPNNSLTVLLPTRPPTPTPPPGPCKNNVCITAIGEISTDPVGFVKSIFGIILSLSGGIALLLIILSGYKLMFSQGNPEKAQEAKETLTAAIVGLLFIIFSLVILQVIGVDILRIPGFESK